MFDDILFRLFCKATTNLLTAQDVSMKAGTSYFQLNWDLGTELGDFLTFQKADCSLFARLVGWTVGRCHH